MALDGLFKGALFSYDEEEAEAELRGILSCSPAGRL